MGVIGLLTDYGLKDAYVARVKAKIARLSPDSKVIDISHDVQKFHLPEAAYLLANVWRDFPKGSVFLIGVDHPYELCKYVLCEVEGKYFIASDSGLLSLLFDQDRMTPLKFDRVCSLDVQEEHPFELYNSLVEVALDIVNSGAVDDSLECIEDVKRFTQDGIKIVSDKIFGKVLYVDSYGNIITNIHRDIVEVNSLGRSFEVKAGSEYIPRLSRGYKVGYEAKCVAFYNVDGYLEISITDANASQLLGVKNEVGLIFGNNQVKASEKLGIQYDSVVTIIFTSQQQSLL